VGATNGITQVVEERERESLEAFDPTIPATSDTLETHPTEPTKPSDRPGTGHKSADVNRSRPPVAERGERFPNDSASAPQTWLSGIDTPEARRSREWHAINSEIRRVYGALTSHPEIACGDHPHDHHLPESCTAVRADIATQDDRVGDHPVQCNVGATSHLPEHDQPVDTTAVTAISSAKTGGFRSAK
jgi:hypothetical protein